MMTTNQNKQLLRVVTVFIIIICVFLSSCAKGIESKDQVISTSTVQPVMAATNTFQELSTAMPTETPAPTVTMQTLEEVQRSNYAFDAELDYIKHTLVVTESIRYFNGTGQDLTEIKLVVPPNQYDRVFELKTLLINSDTSSLDYSLDGITLSIVLETPLVANDTINMELQFTLNIPLKFGILGYTTKQTNLSDWYPYVPPFDPNTGWIIHQPAEVGEYLVYEMADFDLTLKLTGPPELVIAGSTEAVPIEPFIYQLTMPNSRNITFSVSDQYQKLTRQFGNTTVRAFVFDGDETSGNAAIEATGKALLFFSDRFGVVYPHETMTIVEADFADGMEYDGLYYLSKDYFLKYDSSFQNYLSLLSVHETAHQWWFGIVGNDQALEPWVDESLATYSEYLYIEYYRPELMNWWWEYRVDEYNPSGKVDLTIYDQSDLRPYINAVYLQGASFLHELRGILGDDAFFAGLRSYAETYKFENASWNDFLEIMIPVPSDALSDGINKYFQNNP